MLSCRHSGPGTPLYARRLSSTDCILSIVASGVTENLPPLPLVPYAVSMCTTVIYRALRDSQRGVEAACRDLELCCGALDELGQRWTSVKGMARLARKLWRVTRERVKDSNRSAPRVRTVESLTIEGLVEPPREPVLAGLPLSSPLTLDAEVLSASNFELDLAFDDLFDYGLLNGIRDPATWEFLHMDNEQVL